MPDLDSRARVAIAAVAATTALIVAIDLSRVYLGVHYPTDVIVGTVAGSMWSLLVAWRLRPAGPRSPRSAPSGC